MRATNALGRALRVGHVYGERGQSEVLGTALIIALTLTGAGLVVTVGGDAIDQTSEQLSSGTAENEMTLFDTRVAVATLGQSSPQEVQLRERGDGGYYVEGDAGWLRVTHVNADGGSNDPGDDKTIYNGTLGAVVYERPGVEIGYQAGGVWRYQDGGSVMVSPPAFHYRQATLSLPVIRVRGEESASGETTARVVVTRRNEPVYPNASATYDDGTPYVNPVESGRVQVTVHSRYYQAWADYFRSRTDGNVTSVDDGDRTTTMNLTTVGMRGEFEMPRDDNAIRIRGLDGNHSLNNFTVTLYADSQDNADFSNLDWELRSKSGSREFRFELVNDGGNVCPRDKNGRIDAIITYANATSTQTWRAEGPFKASGNGYTLDCSGTPSITMNLTSETNVTYQGDVSSLNFTAHPDVDDTGQYATGENETSNFLINHYLSLLSPSVDLEVQDFGKGGGNSASGGIDESASFGTLEYDATDRVVTYLRVTDNEVRVSFI